MSDIIDQANDRAAADTDHSITEARIRAASMPAGVPGDCDLCGEWSQRLVDGACAPCRDKYGLP